MKCALSLTHACNLACTYCYAGSIRKPAMTEETARAAIDFVVDRTQPWEPLEIGFFGGEPFLCFDQMRETTEYLRSRTEGRPTRLQVTTNGTLLSDEMLTWLEQENVSLCFSIDGTAERHDGRRRYRDGRPSFEVVSANLRTAVSRLGDLEVNAVYGPEDLEALTDTVSVLETFGPSLIHLNPNIRASWSEEDAIRLAAAYHALAAHYIERYRAGVRLAVTLIDSKIAAILGHGYAASDRCGMGEREFGIAPSGNVYPCERFIGADITESSFCLGNVHNSDAIRQVCRGRAERSEPERPCTSCGIRDYCMHWCGCSNFAFTGDADLPGPILCASEKAAIAAAHHVLATLTRERNELFMNHVLRRSDGRCHLPVQEGESP